MNLLYQQYVRPRTVHAAGVALSIAGNAGGGTSGTTAWARLGVDTTFRVGYDPDANDTTAWEFRVTPTFRGRLFGDAVTTLALGPQFTSHGDAELLAARRVRSDTLQGTRLRGVSGVRIDSPERRG